MALQLNIYPQGRNAIVNLPNTGTNAVQITHIGVTATAFDPNDYPATLPGELKRLTTFGGMTVAPDTIHVTLRDDSDDSYSLRGFALYLADGTLFAMYGQASVILEKSTQALLLLSTDIRFVDIDANSIEFGDANFVNPPATTTVMGVTQYATNPEALAGNLDNRSIVASALKYVLDQRFGVFAPTEFMKGLLSVATAAGIRTALSLTSPATKNEGAGNGLDSDLLDGQHGAYYLNYSNLTNKPATAIAVTEKGAPNGVATLDGSGKIPTSQLPLLALADVFVVTTQAAQLALTAQEGDVAVRSDLNRSYIHNGGTAGTMADWQELLTPTDAVLTVAGRTGAIVLAIADITGLQTVLDAKAALASPAFSGTPTAPTAAPGTNTTQLATTAFVNALGALKANIASPTFTGTPAAPTAGAGTSTTQLATTEFVQAAITAALANYLPKNNPTFTGVMTGPAYNET